MSRLEVKKIMVTLSVPSILLYEYLCLTQLSYSYVYGSQNRTTKLTSQRVKNKYSLYFQNLYTVINSLFVYYGLCMFHQWSDKILFIDKKWVKLINFGQKNFNNYVLVKSSEPTYVSRVKSF